MKLIRNLILSVPVLTLVGCGCNGDDGTFIQSQRAPNPFRVGTFVPPIPVEPQQGSIKKIDVLFLLDDSGIQAPPPGAPSPQSGMVYSNIVDLTPDNRKRQETAQAIFQDMVLAEKLKLEIEAANPGVQIDIAFGVARYEDFGGAFHTNDAQARPFILNMPILRQKHPNFAPTFSGALPRNAPGNGNNPLEVQDVESVTEALYQIGTGAGFDADGGGSNGSGLAGALVTQTSPGTSGDVPAPGFSALANDPDNRPQFQTAGGAIASGNLGGVGWRPNALRYVITTSDIANVSPMAAIANVTSTAGAGGYPRLAKSIPPAAFDGTSGRYGTAPGIAPAGAHTVQASVDALNALNIEVLSIGTLRSAPVPFKPNQPGAAFPNVAAIPNPSSPDPSPFTWMSAYAILTGADRPWPTPADPVLPLVYNLATVFPKGGTVQGDVREDMVYRVGQAIGTVTAEGSGGGGGAVGNAEYDFTLSLTPAPGSPFNVTQSAIDSDGAGTAVTVLPGNVIHVIVPRYTAGQPAPAAIRIEWAVQITEKVPNNDVKNDTIPFTIQGVGTTPHNPPSSPTPVLVANSSNVFYSLPAAPPNPTGTFVLGVTSSGCVFLANQTGGGLTQGGTCP